MAWRALPTCKCMLCTPACTDVRGAHVIGARWHVGFDLCNAYHNAQVLDMCIGIFVRIAERITHLWLNVIYIC